jgi:DNA-binding HxlR family transcriptional regulator
MMYSPVSQVGTFLYCTNLKVTYTIAQNREGTEMVIKQTPCPVEATVNLIGNKWKVLIMRELFEGTKRFSELFRSKGLPGISQKMLAQQLRQMEADEIVARKVYAQVPPKVEYSLTTLGRSLKPY